MSGMVHFVDPTWIHIDPNALPEAFGTLDDLIKATIAEVPAPVMTRKALAPGQPAARPPLTKKYSSTNAGYRAALTNDSLIQALLNLKERKKIPGGGAVISVNEQGHNRSFTHGFRAEAIPVVEPSGVKPAVGHQRPSSATPILREDVLPDRTRS